MFLEYSGIRVTDLERSLQFYTELLGLKEVRSGEGYFAAEGQERSIWVLLEDAESGQHLELNWYPEGHRYATAYAPGEGLDHIGFVVKNTRETFERLVAAGVEPVIGPEETMGWTAYLKDPDGNWIEIFQRTEPEPQEGAG